jgi:outer membrane protein assembly factor BamB
MSKSRHKTMATMIAVLLTLTIAIPLFALPSANAASTVKTYPLIEALPNPVGVGQKTLINFGLLNYLNTATDGWNITVTITKPDNTTETLGNGPLMTWSTGNAGYYYTPTEVGTYYVQSSFDQTTYRGTIYLASKSDKLALIVQNEPVPTYPGQPLPGEYWTRPIDDQLRSWYTLAGSWLTDPNDLVSEYNQGPESAHILWARPIGGEQGGLVGGEYSDGVGEVSGEHAFADGDAYEGKWGTRLIVAGILYYTEYEVQGNTQSLIAINLRTGEVLWKNKLGGSLPSFGQILYWDSRNNRGAFSYLVVQTGGGFGASAAPTTWRFYEPLTGEWVFNMTNVPGGTVYRDGIGSLVKYSIGGGRLTQWNASYAVIAGRTGMSESWGSAVSGVSINVTTRRNGGYDINVTVPSGLPGSIINVWPGVKIVGGTTSMTAGVTLWGISLEPGYEGRLLFNQSTPAPSEWAAGNVSLGMQGGWVATSQEAGALWVNLPRKHWVYSFETGKFLFETPSQHFADAWDDSPGSSHNIYMGKLISASVSGHVYAYDLKTGKIAWTYNATDPYSESYISTNWWLMSVFFTDGKCYIGSMEHSAQNPKPRGAPFICLNATDGTLIWRADGLFRQTRWGGRAIIGDSVIATMDTFDQRVYAIGKGPSTMTVTAPDTAVPLNTPLIIRGTVMDNSPGTQDDAMKLRFPKGVPAISDASMSDWMLYVYKQFAQPTTATGVAVSIDAVDPNNNYVHLGDATTDGSGMFSAAVIPEVPGYYAVYATFVGSAGYYASYAETSLYVSEPPAATPAPTPTPVPITEQYFVLAVVGIIVAIIIVGVVLALLLIRKRA